MLSKEIKIWMGSYLVAVQDERLHLKTRNDEPMCKNDALAVSEALCKGNDSIAVL